MESPFDFGVAPTPCPGTISIDWFEYLAAPKPDSNRLEFAISNATDDMELVAFAQTIGVVETEANFLVH